MQYKVSNLGSELFTTEEVKNYLKITYTDDDTYIDSLIKSSRELAENYLGISLITKTIEVFFDEGEIDETVEDYILPFPPHNALTEVKRGEDVLDASSYQKRGLSQFIVRLNKTWIFGSQTEADNSVTFTYTTLAETNNLTEIKSALFKNIGEQYEMRKNGFEGSYSQLSENTISKLNRFKIN